MSDSVQKGATLVVTPEDVIEMARQNTLSMILANGWFHRSGKLPVEDGEKAVKSRKRYTALKWFLVGVCVVAVLVFVWMFYNKSSTRPPTSGEKDVMLVAVCSTVMSFLFAIGAHASRNLKVRNYSSWYGGFGYDFATVSQLAGLGRLLVRDDDAAIPTLVEQALINEAERFENSERANLNRFAASRLLPGKAQYPESARDEFGRLFDAAKRFGLTHPDDWDYYFAKVAERRIATAGQ